MTDLKLNTELIAESQSKCLLSFTAFYFQNKFDKLYFFFYTTTQIHYIQIHTFYKYDYAHVQINLNPYIMYFTAEPYLIQHYQ